MFLWAKRHHQIFSIMMKTSGPLRAVRLCSASSQILPQCSCPSTARGIPDLQLGDTRHCPHRGTDSCRILIPCLWILGTASPGRWKSLPEFFFFFFFAFLVSSRSCFHHCLCVCSSGLAAPWLPSWNEGGTSVLSARALIFTVKTCFSNNVF